MKIEAFKVILNNAALLLSMVVVFYLLWSEKRKTGLLNSIVAGVVLGLTTIGIMTNSYALFPGLFVDSRTIIIGLSAIFFSPISSLISVLFAVIFRISIGGLVLSGVIPIVAAYLWGILIRIYKTRKNLPFNQYDFLLIAMLNHLVMMSMIFLTPAHLREETLYSVNLPVLLIFPATTMIIGHMLSLRIKHTEDDRKLSLSEERYRLLTESSNDIIMIRDIKGILLFANKRAQDFLGIADEDVGQVNIADYITEEHRQKYVDYYATDEKELIENRQDRLTVRDKSGRKRWIDTVSSPIWDKDSFHGVMISARDITSRVEAEALRQRNAIRLEILRDLSNMVVQNISFDESCNVASKKLKELINFDFLSINVIVGNEVEVVEIQKTPGRFEYLHKNQKHIPSRNFLNELQQKESIIISELADNPTDMPVRARLVKDGMASFMYNAMTLKDELLGFLWFGSSVASFFTKEDLEIGQDFANQLAISLNHLTLIQTIRENSEELARVVEDKTRELKSALSEVETFSYTVAHDLRAPLKMIQGYVEFLEDDFGKVLGEEGGKMLLSIDRIVKHSDKLILELLDLARLNTGAMDWQRTNMRKLVDDALKTLSPEGIGLEINKLPDTWGDPSLLSLVWQNLLENAIKFTREKELRMISIGAKAGDEGYVYYVEDNGIGFDPEDSEVIFAPFKRLRSEQNIEGTGIGLAIVKKIVMLHKGSIWAESEPGKGSGFYFSLPPLKSKQ